MVGKSGIQRRESLLSSTSSRNNRSNRHWLNTGTKRDDEDDDAWRKYDSERGTRKTYKKKDSSLWKTSPSSNDNDYSDNDKDDQGVDVNYDSAGRDLGNSGGGRSDPP